jgi:Peptidase inhibitor I78 family
MITMRALHFHQLIALVALLVLASCGGNGTIFPSAPTIMPGATIMGGAIPDPVIRQPVLPEFLVGCRGHVLVPALGMTFVARSAPSPLSGQYLREESLTSPYRVIRPGDRLSQDRSPQRLNVELDGYGRVIGLACG